MADGARSLPRVDWGALRWHLFLWDLWFLVWGLLLGVAAWQYMRRALAAASARFSGWIRGWARMPVGVPG